MKPLTGGLTPSSTGVSQISPHHSSHPPPPLQARAGAERGPRGAGQSLGEKGRPPSAQGGQSRGEDFGLGGPPGASGSAPRLQASITVRLCYSSAAKWFVTPDWSNCFEMGYIIYNYRARGGAAGLRFHLPQVHPHVEITLIWGRFKEGPPISPADPGPLTPFRMRRHQEAPAQPTERSRRGRGGPGRGAGSPPANSSRAPAG